MCDVIARLEFFVYHKQHPPPTFGLTGIMPSHWSKSAILLSPRPCVRSQCLMQRNPKPDLDRRRNISTYGYVQAKSLVYSKHGSPQDVLKYIPPSPPSHTRAANIQVTG